MNIKILSDSTCDLSPAQLEELNVDLARLTVVKDGEEILYSATSGLIPVCIMGVSALVMVVCGVLMKLPKMKWLSEYALPISLIVGMASAIPFTGWLS